MICFLSIALPCCVVKPGDTLSEIGQRFKRSWRALAAVNSIRNPDLIFPGQVLRLDTPRVSNTYNDR